MSDLLYHAYFPESHEFHVSQQEVMNSGIKYSMKSNHRYSNGGRVKLEITENLRPSDISKWINFKEAIGADIINRFSESFCFPIFTDKIFVFDSEISLSIYDQAFYEDMKEFDEEALNFDTGETIDYWIEQYWKSMIPLKDYLRKRPYPKPEVLIFEPVPKEIISFCEE
ncbi:DNA polymerase III [Bacillus pumilus]|uniref:DNA polymerase III n=1 Tax=Bacillus pumilus TaxID=1408 RepID=UPI0020422F6C|nr:DNA polymerase III [Bacillus pumilus]MCM3036846.1 DNA polymerase III [Bacillus pumilus]